MKIDLTYTDNKDSINLIVKVETLIDFIVNIAKDPKTQYEIRVPNNHITITKVPQ